MDDYISRKTAIDEFDGVKVDEENCTEYDIGYNDGIDFAVSRLSVLPSADVQAVVRCKDCKYFDSGTDEDGKPFFKCLGWVYGGTSEDDFCSHGERKDG